MGGFKGKSTKAWGVKAVGHKGKGRWIQGWECVSTRGHKGARALSPIHPHVLFTRNHQKPVHKRQDTTSKQIKSISENSRGMRMFNSLV